MTSGTGSLYRRRSGKHARCRALRGSAARERGAIFVEALIVISLLTLGLMGLAFFRDFYIRQLTASRLARASTMAYSMSGCGNTQPRQWIGARDVGKYAVGSPRDEKVESRGENAQPSATSNDSRASSILGSLGGVSGDGAGVVNPITATQVSRTVSLETSSGFLNMARRKMFQAEPRSSAFVSCGDPVRQGDFEEAIGYIKELF